MKRVILINDVCYYLRRSIDAAQVEQQSLQENLINDDSGIISRQISYYNGYIVALETALRYFSTHN